MPSRVLPGLGLNGFWALNDPWKTGADENWLRLSVMTSLVVESATTNLPGSPANGATYIVPTGQTNAGRVAVRDAGAWVYFVPPIGQTGWVKDTSRRVRFNGTTWVDELESGTFTPTIYGATTAGTPVYASGGQSGTFTRVGNRIMYTLRIALTSKGGMAGGMRIAGLPSAAAAGAGSRGASSVYAYNLASMFNPVPIQAHNREATSELALVRASTMVGSGMVGLVPADVDDTFIVHISGQYQAGS